jgi:uncharacterized protein
METLNTGMADRETLLEFPCTYPLKVMGRNTEEFQELVRSIMERNTQEGAELSYSTRTSGGEKYLSITVTFVAQDQRQLKAIYTELESSSLVLVAL